MTMNTISIFFKKSFSYQCPPRRQEKKGKYNRGLWSELLILTVYFDNEKERYFIKRFLIEIIDKEDDFIKDGGRLIYIGFDWLPILEVHFEKPRGKEQPESMIVNADEFISVKGYKAQGNQLTNKKVKSVSLKEALAYELPEEENIHEIEVDVEEGMSSESKKDDDTQITLDF